MRIFTLFMVIVLTCSVVVVAQRQVKSPNVAISSKSVVFQCKTAGLLNPWQSSPIIMDSVSAEFR